MSDILRLDHVGYAYPGGRLVLRDVSLSVVEPPVGLDLNAWATITPGWSANLSTDSLPDVPIGRFVS